jgi:molecular chaperone DnaK (HSP70)
VESWDGVVRRVVIGVPANSSEKKKEATRRAARTAGFEDVRIYSHKL